MTRITSLLRSCLMVAAMTAMGTSLGAAELNDYPTAARADYVFACMKTNGETRQALEQCSCSIDMIASILPYDRYVAAEAVFWPFPLGCRGGGGGPVSLPSPAR